MQWLFDTVQQVTAAQNCLLPSGDPNSTCPAHALHAITAAMATQGYWVQADLLYFLEYTNFQTWAILVYMLSFIGALVSMALGVPPKMYLWFIVGPGIFHWLIADTVPMQGVRWNVGPRDSSDPSSDDIRKAQNEVWKLAEVGLLNTNVAKRGGFIISSNAAPAGGTGIGFAGNGTVRVSQLFSYYDRLLSDLVDFAISWTGLYTMRASNAQGNSSNIARQDLHDQTRKGGGGSIDHQNWLLSNLKWTMLEDITGAKLSSGDLRDAFATFMGSECGDAFTAGIDEAQFIAASNSKGLTVPDSIFLRVPSIAGAAGLTEYQILTQELISQSIPSPTSLKRFLEKGGIGSFRESINFLNDPGSVRNSGIMDEIRCDQFLYLLTHAFRWEAGHIYYQLVSRLPGGFNPAALHYAMMYGWAIKKYDNGPLGVILSSTTLDELLFGGDIGTARVVDLTPVEAMRFFQNLILIHLWRNEMALAPQPLKARKSSSEESVSYVEAYQKTAGAKSKFGEVYTWALLMPKVQGVLLYFLAMAYPICAMLTLIPGWHKILFTWASFWAWVKIWDIGFALVFTIERSMWAMIGNTPEAERLFSKVLLMDQNIDQINGSKVDVVCPINLMSLNVTALGNYFTPPPLGICPAGVVPQVYTTGSNGVVDPTSGVMSIVGGSLGALGLNIGSFETWFKSLKIMDRSLTLGASMQLDLSNSYYIYIMSALYFAVPAVTGQLVLGAKAAAASLATNAVGGLAGESGRAAGSGFSGDLSQRARANQTAVGQAAYAKDMRSQAAAGGFAAQALQQGNAKLMAEAGAAYNNAANSGEGQLSKMAAHRLNADQQALSYASAGVDAQFSQASNTANFGARLLKPAGASPGSTPAGSAPGSAQASTTGDAGSARGGGGGQTGSATGAPTGAGGVGLQNWTVQNASRGSDAIGTAVANVKASYDASKQQMLAGLSAGNINQQAMHDAFQGQAGVNAFGYSQSARGMDVSSGRNSAAADFSAKSAQYDSERNYAQQLGGELAAMGAGGAVSVGAKPVGMDGMAMTGQLGKGMRSDAEFAGKGFQNFVQAGQERLQGMYGYGAMMQQYRPGDGKALMDRVQSGIGAGQRELFGIVRAGGDVLTPGGEQMPNSAMQSPSPPKSIGTNHPNLGQIETPKPKAVPN